MYDANSEDEPYAYRRFRSDGVLENRSVGDEHGAATGLYTRQGNGKYYGDYSSIAKYITDGMLLFLDNID